MKLIVLKYVGGILALVLMFTAGWVVRGEFSNGFTAAEDALPRQTVAETSTGAGTPPDLPSPASVAAFSQSGVEQAAVVAETELKSGNEPDALDFTDAIDHLLTSKGYPQILQLIESFDGEMPEPAWQAIAAHLVSDSVRRSFQTHEAGVSYAQLIRSYISYRAYTPAAQFLQINSMASEQPFVALATLDELSSYYQEQVSFEHLQMLESWLIDTTESRFRADHRWEDLELWVQKLISRSSEPSHLYYRLAEIQYQRRLYELSLESLDKAAVSAPLSTQGQKLKELNFRGLDSLSVIRIPIQRVGKHFIADVKINERIPARLLIDTGASLTGLSRSFVHSRSLNVSSQRIRIRTPAGVIETGLVPISSLSLNGARVENLSAVIIEAGSPYDGLLGMDFLGAYQFYLDQAGSLLYLRDPVAGGESEYGTNVSPFSEF